MRWSLGSELILRGSRAKKVVDAQLDKLPFHGLGKELSANWWKELAYQLISNDYLLETFKDMYKSVGVGPKGMQFLTSCGPDHQPPLHLALIPAMMGCKVNKDAVGESGTCNGLSKIQSQLEEDQLFKMLVQERMKLARNSGTAPYAVCGDVTLRRITLTRPSTREKLANIDGVNQHFLKAYGDHFLQAIQRKSKELSLTLDWEPIEEPPNSRKITPSKLEAWKRWQETVLQSNKLQIIHLEQLH